jgi:hypothetical protein
MTFIRDDENKNLTITFNEVQYALLKFALAREEEFERLILSHLQLVQDRQRELQKHELLNFVERATDVQKAELLALANEKRGK